MSLLCRFLCLLAPGLLAAAAVAPRPAGPLRFEVSLAPDLLDGPRQGRLLVVLSRQEEGEPRHSLGEIGLHAAPLLARDATFGPGGSVLVDQSAALYPLDRLADLPAGRYRMQALFVHNRDLNRPDAPGNLVSPVSTATLDPARGGTFRLSLNKALPADVPPRDAGLVRYLKFPSPRLSRFHGRPMFLRVGVILPADYDTNRERRYPLRVSIGGYGTRYTEVGNMMSKGSDFRRAWLARGAPAFVLLHLDGAGPFGDPYQVDSANNGPYGAAITEELIPHIEKNYRCIGQPWARTLEGASTGGWVSLALQVFYPDYFNGAWSHCPDPVDFRSLEVIDLYRDPNAFVNARGFDRPSARELNGDVRWTIRSEVRHEAVLGRGGNWTLSGKDWAAWNATFSPRGADGLPRPVWDGKTGKIDRTVAEHWRKYDLRYRLETEADRLAPKLKGKLRIWVGDADEYFLNNAVRRLDAFLSRHKGFDARITFKAGKGHNWRGLTEAEMLREMSRAVERARPR